MADDFGDDAGGKLLDWSIRIMIERGRLRARESSEGLAHALREAQARAAPGGPAREEAESGGWAKLDVRDLARIDGWEEVRGAIDAELDGRGLAHEWFEDGPSGERRLLFRTGDARELADSLGRLAEKAEEACSRAERAVERAREAGGDARDPRRDRSLRERVRTVRRYAEGPERAGRAGREPERAESLERGRKR